MSIGIFVMTFGINNSAERIRVVAQFNSSLHRVHIPPAIVRPNDGLTDWMNKPRVPLRFESRATRTSIFRQPRVLLHVFGDADLPRLCPDGLVVDPLHKVPTFRDILGRIIARSDNVPNPTRRIPAKPVAKSLLQPANGAVAEILANLASAVIGPVIAPRRRLSPIVIKVNSAAAILVPSIKLPKIAVIRTDVVENN